MTDILAQDVRAIIGSYSDDQNWSGISGFDTAERHVDEFARQLDRYGHVTTNPVGWIRPMNHFVVGIGIGHDDATFAETGKSMAAYYENGETFDGARWWDDTLSMRHVRKQYEGRDES